MVQSIEEIKNYIESGRKYIDLFGKYGFPPCYLDDHLVWDSEIDDDGAKVIADLLKGNTSVENLYLVLLHKHIHISLPHL